ncbi:MAG: hypothetical protein ACHQQ3_08755 [Gemmatimonadales bacterium]
MKETIVAVLACAVLFVLGGLLPHRGCTGHCVGCTGSCGRYKEELDDDK